MFVPSPMPLYSDPGGSVPGFPGINMGMLTGMLGGGGGGAGQGAGISSALKLG
jgi:hypothetical protein